MSGNGSLSSTGGCFLGRFVIFRTDCFGCLLGSPVVSDVEALNATTGCDAQEVACQGRGEQRAWYREIRVRQGENDEGEEAERALTLPRVCLDSKASTNR